MQGRGFVAVALLAVLAAACGPGVFTHAGNSDRNGDYADQAGLTPQLVGGGTFGQMFDAPLDGQVYAQPVISNGTVVVGTETNHVYGIDAVSGARKWTRDVGVPWNPNDVACPDLVASVGITSTPGIYPAPNTAFG